MSDETEFAIICDPRIAPTIKAFLEASPLPHPCGDGRMPIAIGIQANADFGILSLCNPDCRSEVMIRYGKPLPSLESLAAKWLSTFEYADRAKLWMAMRKRGVPSFSYRGSRLTVVDDGNLNPPQCMIAIS